MSKSQEKLKLGEKSFKLGDGSWMTEDGRRKS